MKLTKRQRQLDKQMRVASMYGYGGNLRENLIQSMQISAHRIELLYAHRLGTHHIVKASYARTTLELFRVRYPSQVMWP